MNMTLVVAQLLNGIAIGMLYALMAFGLSIIKGLLNIPNFAHGAMYALGAYVFYAVLQISDSFLLGLILAPIAVGVIGMIIEAVGVRRVYGSAYLFQLLLLFGVGLMMQEVIIIIWGAVGKSVLPPAFTAGAFDLGISFYPKYLLFTTVTTTVLITLVWILIEKTRYGAILRAGIEKKEMVSALGINVDRLFTITFGIGAALTAFAGALAVPLVGVTPSMGMDMLAIAFVVVVIGGLGSLYGAVAAGLLVGIVQSLSAIWFPAASTIMIYVAMAVIIAIRPQGLLGEW